jgi:hypothetical protein
MPQMGGIILILSGVKKTRIKPPNLYGESKSVETWKME